MNALILLFYRIVTFFTRVEPQTCKKHAIFYAENNHLKDIESGMNFIDDQNKLNDIPYGHKYMSENGCGVIALYNALIELGVRMTTPSIISIASQFEKKGIVLKGKFGTSPFAVLSYLKSLGLRVNVIKSKNIDKINSFSMNYDVFISVIIFNKHSLLDGLHFVCVRKNEDGSFSSHNPNMTGTNLYETLNKCSIYEIKHLYTIGINKGENNE